MSVIRSSNKLSAAIQTGLNALSNWIVGKITLPSTILKFWDLGGQRGIRSIWHRYYDDCHAVVFVIDAEDRERLSEGWEVFGECPSGLLGMSVLSC